MHRLRPRTGTRTAACPHGQHQQYPDESMDDLRQTRAGTVRQRCCRSRNGWSLQDRQRGLTISRYSSSVGRQSYFSLALAPARRSSSSKQSSLSSVLHVPCRMQQQGTSEGSNVNDAVCFFYADCIGNRISQNHTAFCVGAENLYRFAVHRGHNIAEWWRNWTDGFLQSEQRQAHWLLPCF